MRLLWVTAVVLVADQVTKQIVLRTMHRGQSIDLVGEWLKLTFTENPGMAFGIQFGPPGTVTVLAILATLLIIVYLYQVRRGYLPYRLSLAFILGGALGNIIDRVFYGVLQGTGTLFTGRVVDFIHVDAWRGIVPEAVPFFGGDYMMLFPIWNVADMAIVCGVVGILVFQRQFHDQLMAEAERAEAERAQATSSDLAAAEASPPMAPPDTAAPPVARNGEAPVPPASPVDTSAPTPADADTDPPRS